MSELFAQPLRIVAMVLGLALVLAAGSIQEQESTTKASRADGWAAAAVDAALVERDPTITRGRDPFADPALARDIERRYARAFDAVELERRSQKLSPEMDAVATAAGDFLAHTEQVYRTASIHQEGFDPPRADSEYFVQEFAEQEQLRVAFVKALEAADLRPLALRLTPKPAATP